MLIYITETDGQTDRQTHQKYSSEPHNKLNNPTEHDAACFSKFL